MQSTQAWTQRHFDAEDDEVGAFLCIPGRTDLVYVHLLFPSS